MSTTPFFSPAAYSERLNSELPHASGSELLPLLIGSRVLPGSMRDARMLPVVVYGADPYRIEHPSGGHQGVVDLLSSDAPHLGQTIYDEYFNPHGALKKAAASVVLSPPNAPAGQRPPKHKGTRFHHAGYVIGDRSGRHLFVEIAPDDLEARADMLPVLAKAYDLGSVAVGDQVVHGRGRSNRLPRSGLPGIIREVGQTILHLPYANGAKIALLQEVVKSLEANRSPNYGHRVPSIRRRPAERRSA